jgi:hypothetical protein
MTSTDIFQTLTANGAKGSLFQNIRPVPNNSPVTVLTDNALRCNVNGATGSGTTTVSVAAGSSVSFTADQAVYHQGPVSFYMSKVSSAAQADGSGDWCKTGYSADFRRCLLTDNSQDQGDWP